MRHSAYLPTYLSQIPVRGSNFPLYIDQNPCTPPKNCSIRLEKLYTLK